MQSDYYRHGFDAMINFDYQEQAAKAVDCLAQMDTTWQQMAEKLQGFNVLSYLSSHDTRLFREGGDKAAELLLLAPGAVQIFYGDESSRPLLPVLIRCKVRVRTTGRMLAVNLPPASRTGRKSASSAPVIPQLARANKRHFR